MPAEVVAHPPPMPPPLPAAPGLAVPVLPPVEGAGCANCGQPLQGPFCAHCGQHYSDIHRSVWRFVLDFFDNLFSWDNKTLRTLRPLLTRPGEITVDYLSGRRARYVHPLRLFLFTSAVCLTLIQFLGSGHTAKDASAKKHRVRVSFDQADKDTSPPASAVPAVPSADPPQGASPSPSPPAAKDERAKGQGSDGDNDDDASGSDPAGALSETIRRRVAQNIRAASEAGRGTTPGKADEEWSDLIRSAAKAGAAADGASKLQQKMAENVQQKLSWLLLALLPIFAVMLRTLYWRQDSYYFAHLVFSLHYHTFLLLFWAAYTVLQLLVRPLFTPFHWLLDLCLALPAVYLFRALRQMYGESDRRTWSKVVMLGSMHLLTLLVGLAITGVLATVMVLS